MRKATDSPLRSLIERLEGLSSEERECRFREREQWLRGVDLLEAFNDLLEAMPEYRVFLKRHAGEIMFLSRAMLRTLRIPDERSVITVTDDELTPGPLADLYRKRDEQVLRTGRPLPGVLEVWFSREGIPEWFICHKRPLRNRRGRLLELLGS